MKHETKSDYELNMQDAFVRMMVWNSIMWDIIHMDLYLLYLQKLLQSMRIEYDNLRLKQEEKQEDNMLNPVWEFLRPDAISLDTLQCRREDPVQETKKMFDDDDFDAATLKVVREENSQDRARNFTVSELNSIYDNHLAKARTDYHIDDDDPPSSVEDLAHRLLTGKFIDTSNRAFQLSNVHYHYRWRDPNVNPDFKGYEEAKKAIYKAHKNFVRKVMTTDWSSEYMDAINDFEAMDFSPKPAVTAPVAANDSTVAKEAAAA